MFVEANETIVAADFTTSAANETMKTEAAEIYSADKTIIAEA